MALLSFTKKIDYGLLLVATIARFGKDNIMSTEKLVKMTGVPRAFAAQIGKDLVKAGILGSKEGRGGGYFLLKDPKQVTLLTVMEAIDGEVSLVDCVTHKGQMCPRGHKCEHRKFMCNLNEKVRGVFSNYSLNSLVK